MVSKILFKIKNSNGFTILELLVVVAVMFLLFSALLILVNPTELKERSRDEKRVSDLSVIDRAIVEYKVDNGTLPDDADTLRTSLVLPTGSTDLSNAATGWISENLSTYLTKLPIDPLNESTYFYSYMHDGDTYEINATFEFDFDTTTDDGGNDPTVYELGDNLTLISP